MGQRIGNFLGALLWIAGAMLWSPEEARPEGRPAPEPMVWHCWYEADGSYKLKCFWVASQSAPSAALGADGPDDLYQLFSERMAAGDLAGATRVVRRFPEAFEGEFLEIPIYTHPYEMAFSVQLAEAVLCHPNPECRVSFDRRLTDDGTRGRVARR
ncbi:MAG: hypothetical protein HYU77_13130 [Betaproteobacteria bacterium]|nr:hypothetical protein [Betaproteobacteria bacterium]